MFVRSCGKLKNHDFLVKVGQVLFKKNIVNYFDTNIGCVVLTDNLKIMHCVNIELRILGSLGCGML